MEKEKTNEGSQPRKRDEKRFAFEAVETKLDYHLNTHKFDESDKQEVLSMVLGLITKRLSKYALSGLIKINIERAEQLSKHGRSLSDDVQRNALRQLEMGAQKLLHEDQNMALTRELPPAGWNLQVWQHMCDKPYKERLVIAGALIAAAIDRQILIETQNAA